MIKTTMIVVLALLLAACGGGETPVDEASAPAADELVESASAVPEPTEVVAIQATPTEIADPASALLEEVSYSVIDDESMPKVKRTVNVRLEERVSAAQLEAMAQMLKDSDSGSYERTFILYYLPDMEVGAGAWATTHFDPDLKVDILGLTAEEFDAMDAEEVEDPSREVVGRWLDDRSYVNERILIYRQDGKTFVERAYADGSSRVSEFVESAVDGGIKFEDKEGSEFGDHFLLTDKGALEVRDADGLIATAKKLDN